MFRSRVAQRYGEMESVDDLRGAYSPPFEIESGACLAHNNRGGT